eukprot:TRINITY_DN5015_c0_g1_i1.p1 TRINITY_DN5015_c0_g1~~TRINITY_DN5015_c0_g1_i1.p1  ORF type:complete len:368 (-),score=52.05 TRINITY_DN5015_c0_g1_i1:529-1632(-)
MLGKYCVQDPGTRPGLHGQTLISFGQPDVDRILGGGVPLGHIVLILEDGVSGHHKSLQRYFLGESVACGQQSLVLTYSNFDDEMIKVPALLNQQQSEEVRKAEETNSNTEQGEEQQLRIAWQYKRYIGNKDTTQLNMQQSSQKSKSSFKRKNAVQAGIAREWCHVFDLSKVMSEQDLKQQGSSPTFNKYEDGCWYQDVRNFVNSVADVKDMRNPLSIGRIIVSSLGNSMGPATTEPQILKFFLLLRSVVRGSRCSALVTCPAALFSPTTQFRIQHLVDKIIELMPLEDNSLVFKLSPDQQSCVGLMKMVGLRDQFYVLRQRRRRLRIEQVEIDPDAEFGGQQDQQQQMQKLNVPGQLCSGPTSKIDF